MKNFITFENPFKNIFSKIKKFFSAGNKFKIAIETSLFVLFLILFLSIPICSFNSSLYLMTWIIAGIVVLLMFIFIIFDGKLKVDLISLSLILFCVLFIISTLLNKPSNFSFTYILMTLFIVITYSFCKSDNDMKKPLLYAAYLGCIIFLFVYLITYRNELLSFNFERLGDVFGDINDIAIFNTIGFAFSFYFLLFNTNIYAKVLSFLLMLLFLFASISSGSKIVLLIGFAILIYSIFTINKKEKLWLSIVETACVLCLLILFINLPFAKELRTRLVSMVELIFNKAEIGAETTDYSTISRINMFIDAITMFLRKPLLGWGSKGFAYYSGINGSWSHNHYSEMLCNTGILGFCAYHLPFVLCFVSYFKNKENKLAFLMLIMFVCAGISIVLTSEKLFSFIIGVIFAMLYDGKDIFAFDLKKFKVIQKYENY